MGLRINPTTGKPEKVVDEAIEITLDTTNFDGVLSAADTDVQKAIDTLDDAMAGGSATWGAITGTLSNQADLQIELDGKANVAHTHVEADITDLDKYTQVEVDNLLSAQDEASELATDTTNFDGILSIADDTIQKALDTLDNFSPSATTWGSITGTLSNQSDLQTALDGKANVSHTHVAADITDFNTAVTNHVDVAANTVARHSHANKALLDTYTQTEANLADAVSKRHTQNTDTSLDLGGANPVTAADLRSHLDDANAHDADEIDTDTTNFNNNLSAADATVQQALDTIDNLIIPGGGGNFGAEFQFTENLSVVVTTSDVFQDILDFNTSNLPVGNYRVEWSYGWNHDNISNDFHARLALDNDFTTNNLLMEHRQEPNDSAGTPVGRYIATATDQLFRLYGFRILNLTGVNNFKLQFRTDMTGDESAIWDATLSIYRVS